LAAPDLPVRVFQLNLMMAVFSMKSEIIRQTETAGPSPVRRRLVKVLATAGIAGSGLLLVPESWVPPIVKFINLPAHAQTSTPDSLRFRFDLINRPLTGQVVSLTQNGTSGLLLLRPGQTPPSPICQQAFAFAGGGYAISVVGGQPSTDVHVTVIGTAENWHPGVTECGGVEMLTMVGGPLNGCFATDDPVRYTITNGNAASYTGDAPVAYHVRPCAQGCQNVADGNAGTITIRDDSGVIPTLTITVRMQGSCI
jgi:hypothetical protein